VLLNAVRIACFVDLSLIEGFGEDKVSAVMRIVSVAAGAAVCFYQVEEAHS
jgi:hypothetical protein